LLKQYVLVGGTNDQYKRMYEESAENIVKYLVTEGQVKDNPELLFIGSYSYGVINPKMDHLSCFVPGMLAMGSKVLNRPKDLEVAIRIAETCYWSYKITATGIGPEIFMFIPKDKPHSDPLNQFPTLKSDTRYLLRPGTCFKLK
jgi:mannosyl-oligosaccharide alpha-1,2-mannosidase